jgi:hypothetical protein
MYAYDWILASCIYVWDLVDGWAYVCGVLVNQNTLGSRCESSASECFPLCVFLSAV